MAHGIRAVVRPGGRTGERQRPLSSFQRLTLRPWSLTLSKQTEFPTSSLATERTSSNKAQGPPSTECENYASCGGVIPSLVCRGKHSTIAHVHEHVHAVPTCQRRTPELERVSHLFSYLITSLTSTCLACLKHLWADTVSCRRLQASMSRPSSLGP